MADWLILPRVRIPSSDFPVVKASCVIDSTQLIEGCHHSSVDLFEPSILLPQVLVPSTPSMLLSIYIDFSHVENTKMNKMRPEFGPFFKNKVDSK